MKDRTYLGREADVRDITARIKADPNATARIYAALDWEHDRKQIKNRIDNTLRHLKRKDRAFARAVLKGLTWKDLGMSKQTFSVRLKKVENVLKGL